jgi:hypothetical protein
MLEGTTLRMMVVNRPYGEFYDFYSISPEYYGYTLYMSFYLSVFYTFLTAGQQYNSVPVLILS